MCTYHREKELVHPPLVIVGEVWKFWKGGGGGC